MRIGIEGIKVGGYTDENAKSGVTVILVENQNNTAGISQRGGSPATIGTDLLRPKHRGNQSVNAIVLTGRSVFGLRVVDAIITKLFELKIGYKIGENLRIPIVASASIFDFYDNTILPTPEWGYKAMENLSEDIPIGRYWAGRGATVGKLKELKYAKPSGQGYYEIQKGNLRVGVISVVNSVGNVYDESGRLIAGEESEEFSVNNVMGTTLGVLITNAKLTNSDACRVASSVENGFASVIRPYNLSLDGDTVFTIATNQVEVSVDKVIFLAYEVARKSVLSIFR
ncbi:peptidase S58 family protein [Sulfolobus sp. E5-1-F]|uniref:P1 family peptidase n=1 Tax=Saccharolobus sp. E5-1-F TaxID=2663019 RepID=UPI001295CB4C|nr:P1 family peptidase [Sulfolobus sp. E5-1-F]QGA53899.1 peptidase S58 family protein [Sulfolobus sp. E5-1-F]